jgi:hypothetical protein
LTEVFEEMRGQLDKEMARIAELRKVLEEDPGESFRVAKQSANGQTPSTSLIQNQLWRVWM